MKNLIRQILGTNCVGRLQVWRARLRARVLSIFAYHPRLSSMFYCLFSRRFDREHHAVLLGRLRYERSMVHIGRSSALLRRNIHRLEKGIVMRPRRPVFAANYIFETVSHFIKCSEVGVFDTAELEWAEDVLDKYFASVDASESAVARAKDLYEHRGVCGGSSRPQSKSPYPRSQIKNSPVTADALESLATQRRSTRWFERKHVDIDLLRRAVGIAALAPSACNRQPFEFYVTNDPGVAQDLGSIPMGTTGFASNFQALVVVVGNLAAYPHERDRHVIYIDGSLAAMQLMLAFETMGLSSCPINWPDVESLERVMAGKLGLTADQRPIMLIAVGYPSPDGGIPYSQKKSVSSLVNVIASVQVA